MDNKELREKIYKMSDDAGNVKIHSMDLLDLIKQQKTQMINEITKYFETMLFDDSGEDKKENIFNFRFEQSKYLIKIKNQL